VLRARKLSAAGVRCWLGRRARQKISSWERPSCIGLGGGLLVGGRPLVANVFEPVGSAVFPVQPCLAIGEAALYAATTLWRVRAVEEWNVLVSDVLEPSDWLAMRENHCEGYPTYQ
jgi:hypothetical protein